ncbi:MAG: DUF1707 domain-containing protein, partial [Corynebacterium matruchotii]|uniref:DUF1707 SHOCT-like domain-containing protein n=1 Tax=Corynebacterium matruchotii TaxID=43768 RepID=UPI0036167BF0
MTSPVPPINPGNRDYRIGDAERQEAMDALGKHFTAGRLDVTEYDNRLASITNAVMQSDLAPVFAEYAQYCWRQQQQQQIQNMFNNINR